MNGGLLVQSSAGANDWLGVYCIQNFGGRKCRERLWRRVLCECTGFVLVDRVLGGSASSAASPVPIRVDGWARVCPVVDRWACLPRRDTRNKVPSYSPPKL